MAASNWDTFVVDGDGNPVPEASLRTAAGVTFEVYKNWIYLRSESLWFKGCGFEFPTFAQINEGSIDIGGADLVAVRGPSDGIYFCLTERIYAEDFSSVAYRHLVGCAVSHDGIGVVEEHLAFLRKVIAEHGHHALGTVDLSRGVRHNQGDAFFAGAFGIETPATPPGEAEEPLITDAIEGMTRRFESDDEHGD